MARQTGSFLMASNLEMRVSAPLDARLVVSTKTELYDYDFSYRGMPVAVTDENALYLLIGADPSLEASWRKIGEDSSVELTQAEYDALTPAEKNNGVVYYVTDGDGSGSGGSSYDDTELRNRIAALEAKLAGFEETRLQMTDGTNTVDKTVLTKPYVSPIRTMFDLAPGLYDAQGDFLREVSVSTEWDSEYGEYISHLQDATGAAGVVLPGGYRAIQPLDAFMYDNAIDWLVIPDSVEYISGLGSEYDIGTIYYRGTAEGAPWGQYSATVNTTGTPLAWERQPQRTMFDLQDGFYDAEGNFLGGADCASEGYAGDTPKDIYDYDIDMVQSTPPTGAVGFALNRFETAGAMYRLSRFVTDDTLEWVALGAMDLDANMPEVVDREGMALPHAIHTIYYNGNSENKTLGTNATINTTGTPLAWN